MPTFDFQCRDCTHVFEFARPFGSSEVPSCPTCGCTETQKMISTPTIVFKGEGFYKTDSRGKDGSEPKDGNEAKDKKDGKDLKDEKASKDLKDEKDSKEPKDEKASKDPKEPKQSKEGNEKKLEKPEKKADNGKL